MAGIIADMSDDIRKLQSLKNEIENVKKSLKSIDIRVRLDLKEDIEARLQSLMKQYNEVVLKIAKVEGEAMLAAKKIDEAINGILSDPLKSFDAELLKMCSNLNKYFDELLTKMESMSSLLQVGKAGIDGSTINNIPTQQLEELRSKNLGLTEQLRAQKEEIKQQQEEWNKLATAIKSDNVGAIEQYKQATSSSSDTIKSAKSELKSLTKDLDENIKYYDKLAAQIASYKSILDRLYAAKQNGMTRVPIGDGATALISSELERFKPQLDDVIQKSKEIALQISDQRKRQAELNAVVEQSNEKHLRTRTLIMDAREQLMQMRAAGLQNTPQYQQASEELGKMRKQMVLVNSEMAYLSNPNKHLSALKTGLQGVAGSASLVVGVMGLFNQKNEEMMMIQTKIQSLLGIIIGLESAYDTVKKSSMVMRAIESVQTKALIASQALEAKAKTTNIALTWSEVAAQKTFNLVAKANPYVLLASAIFTVVGGIYLLVKANKEGSKAQEEMNKKMETSKVMQESYVNSFASTASTQISMYQKLKKEYDLLGNSLNDKKKFILENKDSFHQLGLVISGVSDAENIFINQSDAVVNAIMQRAKATAVGKIAQEKWEQYFKERENSIALQSGLSGIFSKVEYKDGIPMRSLLFDENKSDSTRKELEKSIDEDDERIKTLKNGAEKWSELQIEIEKSINDMLKQAGISTLISSGQKSDIEKLRQKQEKLSDQIIKNDLSLNAERLAIMEDGRKKRLSQSEQEWKEKKASLKKEYDDLIADNKKNGIITPQKVTDTYNARLAENDNAKAKRDADINKEADIEFAEHQQELTAIFLTEEDKRQQGIKERYDKEREWAKKQLDGQNMTDDEYKKYTILIDNAESGEMLKGLLDEYQGYTDKRLTIEKKFDDDIAALDKQREIAVKNGDTQTVEKIDRAKDKAVKDKNEAISAIDFEQFQKDIDWTILFDNLNKQSTTALEELRTKIQEYIKSAGDKLSPTDLKTLMDASINLDTTIADRKPFDELVSGYKEYKVAVDAVRKAKEALEKADNPEAKAKATKALSDAERKRAESLTKMTTSVNAIGNGGKELVQAGNDLCDMLASLGVEMPKEVTVALEGMGQVMDSLSSIDFTNPFSIIKGATGALAGIVKTIGGLFGGKKHVISEETFAEYDRLIDAIDELISKQNELVKNSDSISAEIAANEAKLLAERKKQATQNLNLDYLNSYDGSKHTVGYNLAKDLSGYRDAIKNAGIDWDALYGTGRMEGLANLDVDQIKLLQGLPEVWAKLPERVQGYLNDVVKAAESAEEATEGVKENLTGMTFDGFKNSFLDTLKNLDSSSKDFADNLEGYIRDAMLQSLVDTQFNHELKALYEKFASYRSKDSDGGDKITEAELEDLREEQKRLAEQILDERDAMADIFGWKSESTSQSSTSRGFGTEMTHEDTGELSGRFTALQIAGEEIKNQSIIHTGLLSSINDKISLLDLTNDNIPKIMANTPDIGGQTKESITSGYQPQVNVVFPDEKIDVLTLEVSALRGIVNEMRTLQVEGNLDRQEIREGIQVVSKNSPRMISEIVEVKKNTSKL